MPVARIERDCLLITGLPLKTWLENAAKNGMSLAEAGAKFNANSATVWKHARRLGVQWPSQDVQNKRRNLIKFRNEWNTRKGHCEAYDVDYFCVNTTQRRCGLTFQDALEKTILIKRNRFIMSLAA